MAEVVLYLWYFLLAQNVLLVLSGRYPTSHGWGKMHLFHMCRSRGFIIKPQIVEGVAESVQWKSCPYKTMVIAWTKQYFDMIVVLEKVSSMQQTSNELFHFHCVNVLPFISFLSGTLNVCVVNNCLNHVATKEGRHQRMILYGMWMMFFVKGVLNVFNGCSCLWQEKILPFSLLIFC